MTNRERAAAHVEQAAQLLDDSAKRGTPAPVAGQFGLRATAHATLALYFQREADQEDAARNGLG